MGGLLPLTRPRRGAPAAAAQPKSGRRRRGTIEGDRAGEPAGQRPPARQPPTPPCVARARGVRDVAWRAPSSRAGRGARRAGRRAPGAALGVWELGVLACVCAIGIACVGRSLSSPFAASSVASRAGTQSALQPRIVSFTSCRAGRRRRDCHGTAPRTQGRQTGALSSACRARAAAPPWHTAGPGIAEVAAAPPHRLPPPPHVYPLRLCPCLRAHRPPL